MPSQLNGTGLPIRPAPDRSIPKDMPTASPHNRKKHKHSRSSYSESSPLVSRNNSATFRPAKRLMPTPDKTIAVINASGRQAASLIRFATAVGYTVRAQLRNREGVMATEVANNANVQCLDGELYTRHRPTEENRDVTRNGPITGVGVNHKLIDDLFRGAHLAFINTTFYGDEIQIGKAIADAAKKAGIQHFIYSSMPDHAAYNPEWPSLPLWAAKHKVEEYVREIGLPATFLYTGIYHNNFTSLLYPLFCMELQRDGSFEWQAPFHEHVKLPWLDADQDVGPSVIQIFKDGVKKWGGRRIALAFEMMTPLEACEAFARGVGRPVRYVRGPIEIRVPVPAGYREQLVALEKLFSPTEKSPKKQPPYFGDAELEATCPHQAWTLWEAPRCLEEYAHEMFPLEESANGMTWMNTEAEMSPVEEGIEDESQDEVDDEYDDDDDDDGDEGLVMRGLKRDDEEWLA